MWHLYCFRLHRFSCDFHWLRLENPWRHVEHWIANDSVCCFMWCVRPSCETNCFGHLRQRYVSPVCARICLTKWLLLITIFLHRKHSYCLKPRLHWFLCAFHASRENPRLHFAQWNAIDWRRWIFKCWTRFLRWANRFAQYSHPYGFALSELWISLTAPFVNFCLLSGFPVAVTFFRFPPAAADFLHVRIKFERNFPADAVSILFGVFGTLSTACSLRRGIIPTFPIVWITVCRTGAFVVKLPNGLANPFASTCWSFVIGDTVVWSSNTFSSARWMSAESIRLEWYSLS